MNIYVVVTNLKKKVRLKIIAISLGKVDGLLVWPSRVQYSTLLGSLREKSSTRPNVKKKRSRLFRKRNTWNPSHLRGSDAYTITRFSGKILSPPLAALRPLGVWSVYWESFDKKLFRSAVQCFCDANRTLHIPKFKQKGFFSSRLKRKSSEFCVTKGAVFLQ